MGALITQPDSDCCIILREDLDFSGIISVNSLTKSVFKDLLVSRYKPVFYYK